MRPLLPGSKTERILAHLTAGRTLTPIQAVFRFGSMSLSQRIGDLKKRGHRITSTLIRTPSGARVARYKLWRTP